MSDINRVPPVRPQELQSPPPPPPLPPVRPQELQDALDDAKKLLEDVKALKYEKFADGYFLTDEIEGLVSKLKTLFASPALSQYGFSKQYEEFFKNDFPHDPGIFGKAINKSQKAHIQDVLENTIIPTLKKVLDE